ncbi:MAG: transglycosylase SLT domain-containing protein [Bacteroidetes bacterium]|nr:transglycosylase SLT domain-containing protein [Bacteroidota bacterium]MCL2301805.1 transglycosylase SLT domain-containing protein [Lentimicrobiaceae bacterium]
MKKALIIFLKISFISFLLGIGCCFFIVLKAPTSGKQEKVETVIPQTDIEEDVEVVRALLLFHAADYFVYRGAPIGFQYDMLRELERGIGKNVNIKVEADASKMHKELYSNNYDIVIMDFPHNGFLLPFISRSISHSYSYPVLVSGNKTDTANIGPIIVSNDFSAKLFFTNDSPYSNYPIQRNNARTTEELFEKVDHGEIPYLICDYNQAITLLSFYPNVRILDKAGPQFERRWILNKKNAQLNENINYWLLDFKKTPKYRSLLRKYFSQKSPIITSFAKKQQSDISQYDAIIKRYAQKYDFDWRFVASIIFQETKFIPGLTGRGGSYGLMQLMPAVMEYYDISEEDNDEANIRAGIQHLNLIRKYFDDIEDEEERLYFIAASYNAGRGHIFDAQRLSAKYNYDYKKWDNVSKYLILKSQQEFATDSVVKSGYFPGIHAVRYAEQVMNRYLIYKTAYP